MIYINNTTISQTASFPRIADATGSPYALLIRKDGAGRNYTTVPATYQSSDRLVVVMSLTLPAGLADGDWQYILTSNGTTISKGIINLQGIEQTIIQHDEERTYTEYQSEQ